MNSIEQAKAVVEAASEHLAQTKAAAEAKTPKYLRAAFGDEWGYRRWAVALLAAQGWRDWYDMGNALELGHCEVDHVYPLRLAWEKGAYKWTKRQRRRFARDPLCLAITSPRTNRSKYDHDAGHWRPSGEIEFQRFLRRYNAIAEKYALPGSLVTRTNAGGRGGLQR